MNNNEKITNGDIHDDKPITDKSEPAVITIDMPEVKDIPGQEHVKVPRFREMEDVTISSSDEEGEGILDDLNSDEDPDQTVDNNTDVTAEEKNLLIKSAGHQPTDETKDFNDLALDDRDAEGDLLEEKNINQDRNGDDLDTPGAELDNDDENVGEEDEENNLYSQSQKDN